MSESQVAEEITRILSFNNLIRIFGKFEPWVFEDMAEETIHFLKYLLYSMSSSIGTRTEMLLHRFNNTETSNSIISHLRLVSSSWMAAHPTVYEPLLPEGVSIEEYRRHRLEAANGRLDKLGISILVDALLNPIGIELKVLSLGTYDRLTTIYGNLQATRLALPDSHIATVYLLHRPEHYDIIYVQNHSYTGKSKIDGSGISNFSSVLPSA
jgi:hypothetical protein